MWIQMNPIVFYKIVKWKYLGFGLLVWQNKTLYEIP